MKAENWMKWDIDSLEGKKAKWFLLAYDNKDQALGTFLRLVTLLYQKDDHWIALDDMFFDTYCHDSGVERDYVESAIARLISAKLFKSRQNGEFVEFASIRVLEECEKREKLSKARAEAGRQGAETTNNSRQLLGKSQQNAAKSLDKIRLDKKRVNNNINSPNGEDRGGTLKLSQLSWPSSLNSDKCKEALVEWLAHKKARKESYKDVKSVNRLLKHWGKFSEREFLEQVDRSIRNNWAGLHDPEPTKQTQKGAINENGYSESFMHNLKLKEKLLAEEKEDEKRTTD